jgi:UDP-glucose/GDP-mannose dehydrogenase family, NAD binding domain
MTTVGIIGLGYVGLPLAVAFAQEGCDVSDKVAVPWGLDKVVGEVLEVYGPSPQHRYARVRVPIHSPAGETLQEEDISFPENSLRLVAAA